MRRCEVEWNERFTKIDGKWSLFRENNAKINAVADTKEKVYFLLLCNTAYAYIMLVFFNVHLEVMVESK